MSAPIRSDDELIAARKSVGGSINKTAALVGMARSSVQERFKRMALKGYSPEHDWDHITPDGFRAGGVSTYYNKDGVPTAQWVKATADQARQQEILRAAFDGLADTLPRMKTISPPKVVNDDLLSLYVITDYHMGMLAWPEETKGDAWDTDIAERMLHGYFDFATERAAPSKVGVLAQLGDMLHFDSLDAVTPLHKNILDADTRFPRLVRATYNSLKYGVKKMLEKHELVKVIIAEGNHDLASSVHLREHIAAVFEDNPRVEVDVSPAPYYCVEHGDVSLFFHHGHLKKPGDIDKTFTAMFREVFGRTKASYGHMGHMHNKLVVESSLMQIEQHRTLAAPDAYAARNGYMAGRDASVITYHRHRLSEQGRFTVTPGEIWDAIASTNKLREAA